MKKNLILILFLSVFSYAQNREFTHKTFSDLKDCPIVISSFMEGFFSKRYEGYVFGEDIAVCAKTPREHDGFDVDIFQGWKMHVVSWSEHQLNSEHDSGVGLSMSLCINLNNDIYPVFLNSWGGEQFVPLWNENFGTLDSKVDAERFLEAYHSIQHGSKVSVVEAPFEGLGYRFLKQDQWEKLLKKPDSTCFYYEIELNEDRSVKSFKSTGGKVEVVMPSEN